MPSSAPTTTTSGPPAFAAPYYDRALNRAEGLSLAAYQPYTGQRVATSSPLEQTAYNQVAGLQTPGTFQQAADVYGQAANQGLNAFGFQPGKFNDGYTAGGLTGLYQANQTGVGTVTPTDFTASYTGPGTSFDPVAGYQANTISSGYTPGSFTEGKFGKPDADMYMNPYMQSVTDITRREADRDFQKQQRNLRLSAAGRGAFGGSRATLLESEAQRNQDQLQSDIQSKGLSAAYENAQGQYNAERNRQLNVEQAREQAGQVAGSQRLQGQTATEGARLSGSQLGLSAIQAREQAKQTAGAQDLDAQRLEDQSKLQSGQLTLQQYQANEQARQAQGAQGIQGFTAQEGARQADERSALDAFQANEQSRQQAAQLGLTGNAQAIQAGQGLAAVGGQQQQAELARIAQMAQLGGTQRGLQQQELDYLYNTFNEQRNYPQQQLQNFLAALGAGSPGSTTSTPAPSAISQLAGAGLSAAAIAKLLGGA